MADIDPIRRITVETEYDEDEDEARSDLYCAACGEAIEEAVSGTDILALYLRARDHVNRHHAVQLPGFDS